MTEQFEYQCQYCGTAYNHPRAECPYCGELQHFTAEELETYAAMQEDYADSIEEAVDQNEYDDDPYADQDYQTDRPPREAFQYHENYEDEAYPDTDTDLYTAAGQGQLGTDEYLDEGYPEEEYYDDQVAYADDPYHDYPVEQQKYAEAEYGQSVDPVAEAADPQPRRFTLRRAGLGCLGLLLCVGLVYGGLGLLAVRQGLEERAVLTEDESNDHYERGLEHLANNELNLAIAEFELAQSINPTNPDVREALQDAQALAESQPTPTSETRSAAAADMLTQATTHIEEEEWEEAVAVLTDIRDLDPEYEADEISDLLFDTNYQLGLQHIEAEAIEAAQLAFERALVERPDDPDAVIEQTKALLYLEGRLVEPVDPGQAVEIFGQLYSEDSDYVDIEQRYGEALEQYGDALFEEESWCRAEARYLAAQEIQPSRLLQTKIDNVTERCQDAPLAEAATTEPEVEAETQDDDDDPTSTSPAVVARATATPDSPTSSTEAEPETVAASPTTDRSEPTAEPGEEATAEAAPAADTSLGSIIYSRYNASERRWEIVSTSAAGGGSPRVLVTDGQMPSLSRDGNLLLYRTDLPDSIGLHLYNLSTGEDNRITIYQEHISPKWGPGNTDYIFSAQELGTGRWQFFQGFADGKGDPNILGDGRTPAWSPKGDLIAYQGTDRQGNNPGIYVVPFGGGDTVRLTTHESDRSPAFSPDGSQIAYMSTRNGNWDIFAVSTAGGGSARQVTTSGSNDGLPTWSPDGSQIAYVSDAGGRWGIYRVAAQGGDPVRVTDWDGLRQEDWLMAQIWWGP